jgi:beta-glucosidase
MKSHLYGDYVAEKATPLYSFGHGLSYTAYEYSNLTIASPKVGKDEVVEISLQVKNTGDVSGEEVVQLYTRDEYASSPRPMKELKGYVRLALEPGESKKVTFSLQVNQLAFYDSELKLVIEPGRVFVMIGSSSVDLRLNGEFEIVGERRMFVKDRIFECPVSIS